MCSLNSSIFYNHHLPHFFGYKTELSPKNLVPSYKMDLDLCAWLGRIKLILFVANVHTTDLVNCSHSRQGKTLSYSQIQ